jgi:soluble lytic murein transglycosylase-like protein
MKFLNFKFQVFVLVFLCGASAFGQVYNDATLASVRQKDAASRDSTGKLQTLSAAEHGYRGDVYMSNRAFPQAREHYDKIIKIYPNDALVPKALFGMGRSFMWERNYDLCVSFFDDLTKNHPYTKDGREGLAFKGACLVRLGRPAEAAKVYEQYTVMFPNGERIESSYLNVIDALREAKKYEEAEVWVSKVRNRFPNSATATNAVHAALRMEIARKNWRGALKNADDLRLQKFPKGSMASLMEANFLRAYVLEKLGQRDEAITAYLAVPDTLTSYWGWQATERLKTLISANDSTRRAALANRLANLSGLALRASGDFPALYRDDLIKHAASRRVDPRFALAIMKQESSFRTNAKSPAAARGLLQLTADTAQKYTAQANINNFQAEDLYRPSVNIALGSAYLAELQREFPNMLEAVAASYNGGEDNAARWLKRADTKEPFLFASEVGFAETKDYVFKVLGNYRAYRELYTEDLRRK